MRPAWRTAFWFESPLSCLAFLTFAAIVSGTIVVCLPNPNTTEMFLAFALALLPARFTIGGGGVFGRHPAPWPNRLRRGIFLLLKFALVLPVMVSGWVVMIWIGPAARAGRLRNCKLHFVVSDASLGAAGSAEPLPRMPAPAHRTGPNRRIVVDVPRMVRQRVGVRVGHGLLQIPEIRQLLRARVASAGRFLEWPLLAGRRSEATMTLIYATCRNDSLACSPPYYWEAARYSGRRLRSRWRPSGPLNLSIQRCFNREGTPGDDDQRKPRRYWQFQADATYYESLGRGDVPGSGDRPGS